MGLIARLFALSGMLASVSCGSSLSTLTTVDQTSSHGVTATATVGSRGAGGDSVFVRLTNTESHTAFLPRCGSEPLLLHQQFVGGEWTGGVQNFMCLAPAAPGPVQLDPGATLQLVRVFSASGRYRFTVSVATTQDLNDAALATSNAFDIP